MQLQALPVIATVTHNVHILSKLPNIAHVTTGQRQLADKNIIICALQILQVSNVLHTKHL
jgi:hypothetical protein